MTMTGRERLGVEDQREEEVVETGAEAASRSTPTAASFTGHPPGANRHSPWQSYAARANTAARIMANSFISRFSLPFL